MTTIHLDGTIGWEIDARGVREQLPATGTVDLRINTPGGLVDEGIAITNELRRFRRDGGTVNATVTGQCCSMGTYIAMAADRIEVEDNAIFMVHNPSTITWGDHRAMAKTARILESVRNVLARAYVQRTGRPEPEILAELDDETFLFGEEIVTAGYADALVPAGEGPEDRDEAMALAHTRFKAMLAKLKERETDPEQLDQIAALLPQHPATSATTPPENDMADNANQTPAAADHQEPPATQTLELHIDSTDVQAAVQAAIADERSRIADITAACRAAKMPHLAEALITNGTSADQARQQIINAWAEQGGEELHQSPTGSSADSDDFNSLISAKQAEGLSRAAAMRAVIAEHPEAHRAWLARINAA